MAFGNILFGGVIGAGVDISTGAAYDYPDIIIVDMGKTQTLAPKVPTPDQAKSNPSSIEARQNPFAAPAATSVATASAAPLPAPAAAASAPAAALQTK